MSPCDPKTRLRRTETKASKVQKAQRRQHFGASAWTAKAGFLLDVWYCAVKEYYAAQQITLPAAVVDCVFTLVNLGLGYVMIFTLRMGIIGAALAFTISKLLRAPGICSTPVLFSFSSPSAAFPSQPQPWMVYRRAA